MTTETESRLEALERTVGAGRLAELAIEDERKRQGAAERAELKAAAETETAGIAWNRQAIARHWLEQVPVVREAIAALVAANAELERLASDDSDAWLDQRRIANQTGAAPNAVPRCLAALDLPDLARQLREIEASADHFGVHDR